LIQDYDALETNINYPRGDYFLNRIDPEIEEAYITLYKKPPPPVEIHPVKKIKRLKK
jgi:hypothetical protein